MDKIIGTGRLAKDIEKRTGKNGSYYTLTIASDVGFGDNKHTNFRNCSAPEALGERLEKMKVKKGSGVEFELEERISSVKDDAGNYQTKVTYRLLDLHYSSLGGGKKDSDKGTSSSDLSEMSADDFMNELPM